MIWHVARKELTEITRDGRFLWSAFIIIVLLLTSLGVAASRYGQDRALREAATREVRSQWLNQGVKGPHSAAHYGVYAFKPSTPLALFDPGLNDYTGTVTMLEAHKENQPSYKPAQDATSLQRFGDLSGAMILQLLIPLLIILLCFGMISGEREEGTLRQLLSVGAKRSDLVWGKATGVAVTLGLVLVPSVLVGAILSGLIVGESDPHDMIDFPAKVAVLAGSYLAYLAIFVVVSLTVSIMAKSSRTALTILLGFWILNGLLLPRAAADVSRQLYPTPSALELSQAIRIGRDRGPHPHEPNHPNHIAFREKLLATYKVERIEDLPYGFFGLALEADETHGFKVFDRHVGELNRRYAMQNRFQQTIGVLSPFIAVRSLSSALAGTDVDFANQFAAAGEAYRRNLVKVTNDDLKRNTVGWTTFDAEWRYKAGDDVWKRVPAFDFDAPPLGEILARNWLPIAVLAAWLFAGVVALLSVSRRMKIDV